MPTSRGLYPEKRPVVTRMLLSASSARATMERRRSLRRSWSPTTSVRSRSLSSLSSLTSPVMASVRSFTNLPMSPMVWFISSIAVAIGSSSFQLGIWIALWVYDCPLDSGPRFHEGRLCAGMTDGGLGFWFALWVYGFAVLGVRRRGSGRGAAVAGGGSRRVGLRPLWELGTPWGCDQTLPVPPCRPAERGRL